MSGFKLKGEFIGYTRIDYGHINDTFHLTTTGGDYIVQRVNTTIFKNVDGLIGNISGVTEYLRKKMSEEEQSGRNEALYIYRADSGKYYLKAGDGACYRVYDFVQNSVCYQTVVSNEVFKQSAVAFARFQRYLDGYPVSDIVDAIENFHNTRVRFNNLTAAISSDKAGRAAACGEEIAFALDREGMVDKVVDMLADGRLPTRVTHNDTKLNNVLFDADTNTGVCVIDLDTIMKGSLLYDFGDSIRFGCNTAAEDEKDLTKVNFDIGRFQAYTEGYLAVLGDRITENELNLLAFSGILMTFECGMRFLTDYLDGDVYFKTAYPEHNLVRARNQFKLVKEMEASLDASNAIVINAFKGA